MANRNITLSISEETLRAVKVLAAKRETSVSAMINEALESIVDRETGYEQARQEFLSTAGRGFELGTEGKSTWTRDELHER